LIQSTSALVGAELEVRGPAHDAALEAQIVSRMVSGKKIEARVPGANGSARVTERRRWRS
jgi:hypothetical protein